MKRLLSLLLVLCSLLTLLPIGALAASNEIYTLEPVKKVNPGHQEILSIDDLELSDAPDASATPRATVSYANKETAIQQLRDALTARQTNVTLYICTDGSVVDTADAIEEAAVSGHTGNPKEGDYLDRHVGGWSRGGSYYEDDGLLLATLNYEFRYYTTAAQEKTMDAAVDDLLDQLDLWDNTPYQKVKGIYDYITANVTYDNYHSSDYELKYSAYAALVNKSAVCQGYASLFYRLALTLGVDCRYVSGTATGGRHGWNIAQLEDGLYYNLDATWDAGETTYDFFLRCADNFDDHTRDPEKDTAAFHAKYPMSAADYRYDAVKSNIVITKQPANVKVAAGKSASVTVKAAGEGLTYSWYVKDPGASKFVKSSNTKSTYGCPMTAAKSGRQVYCVITDAYGNSLQTNTVTLTVRASVAITKQPVSVRVGSGKTAKVTVQATGDGLTYKWYYANKGSSKFTYTKSFKTNTYSLAMNASRSGRKVYCVVTDKYGNSVKSNTVTLNMGNVVTVTKQPVSVSVANGKTASVKVTATGDGLTYKWYYANKGSSKFTYTKSFKTNTYSLAMNASRSGRKVYCVITDKYGNSVKTNTVTLNMGTPLKITKQPVKASNYNGKTAKVTVKATGDGLTYKWYYANKGSSKFTYTATFKTNVYSLAMNASRDGRKVYCVITDQYGNSVKSDTVTLSLRTELTIAALPGSVSAASGEAAKVTVNATGDGLTYQWYYAAPNAAEFELYPDCTGATFSVTMSSTYDGGRVFCKVIDKYGNFVMSNVTTLTMTASKTLVGTWYVYTVYDANGNNLGGLGLEWWFFINEDQTATLILTDGYADYTWQYYSTGDSLIYYDFIGTSANDLFGGYAFESDRLYLSVGDYIVIFQRAF